MSRRAIFFGLLFVAPFWVVVVAIVAFVRWLW